MWNYYPITHQNDGSPKWKSRGGLQNRCVS